MLCIYRDVLWAGGVNGRKLRNRFYSDEQFYLFYSVIFLKLRENYILFQSLHFSVTRVQHAD